MTSRLTTTEHFNAGASVEGHYEMQEVPYGRDYVWKPAHVVIECGCGHEMDADIHHTMCPACGADHTAIVREGVGRHLADEVFHPWHPEYEVFPTQNTRPRA